MVAQTIAPVGSANVESTSSPGAVSGFNEANVQRIMAIEVPEPVMAARNEAINTSFRRIEQYPVLSRLGALN